MGQELNGTERSWWVYIVICGDGTLYTGCTTDLARRLRQHNGELVGGAKYTRPRRPVKLLGSMQVDNRSVAQREEARVKRLNRSQKLEWCAARGGSDA